LDGTMLDGQPAVFLDPHGTLTRSTPGEPTVRTLELIPGAVTAVEKLHRSGFSLVLVAHEPGLARGTMRDDDLQAWQGNVRGILDNAGIPLGGIYVCPHDPQGTVRGYASDCCCRRPQPGLVLRAAYELGLDLTRSWLVGPSGDDVEAGRRARVSTVLIERAPAQTWLSGSQTRADHLASSLSDAARIIRGASSYWPARRAA
jgi:D,D-heptose 1,7-bisphosphate phosphatase